MIGGFALWILGLALVGWGQQTLGAIAFGVGILTIVLFPPAAWCPEEPEDN